MKKKQRIILMPQRNADYKGLDYYPTPPWATKAIMEKLDLPRGTHIWEPACGEKHMSNVMEDYGHKVWSTDVFDYGQGKRHVYDFENLTVQLGDRALEPPTPEWIITNPPFKLADKFILNALDIATSGVAMLCRLMLLEGSGRYGRVFSNEDPPQPFTCSVSEFPWSRGRLIQTFPE